MSNAVKFFPGVAGLKIHKMGGDAQEVRYTVSGGEESGFRRLIGIARHGKLVWVHKNFR